MSDEYLQRRGRDVTLECSAIRVLSAIEALGQFTAEKITYFEASPLNDAESQKRWQELNDAGKFLRELLAHRKATESQSDAAVKS